MTSIKHTAHSAGQLALDKHPLLVIIINSIFAPNNHALKKSFFFLPPLQMVKLYSSVRERSGRRPAARGAESCAFFRTTQPAERSHVLSLLPHRVHQVLGEVPGTRYVRRTRLFALRSSILFSISVLFAIFSSQVTPVLPLVLLPITTWHRLQTAQHRQGNQLRTSSYWNYYHIANCTI